MSFSNSTAGGLWRFLFWDNSGASTTGGSSGGSNIPTRRRDSRNNRTTGGSDGSSSAGSNNNDNQKDVATKKDQEENVLVELLLSLAFSTAIYCTGVGLFQVSLHLARSFLGFDDSNKDVDRPVPGAAKRVNLILSKKRRTPLRSITKHETHIAEDIIDPDDMDVCFADIGGLDHLKQEIYELAVLPLTRPELFQGKLLQQPTGILLFGRPGCGKTLLAKAIAKESEAVFIPIKLSTILNKWVGESNKLVSATFTLARRLAPSIIFIDEIDTFLSSTVDPSASKSMESLKAEFLTEWDGISTNSRQAPVLVLGATNRPQLIDSAILRRLPCTFEVPLPDVAGREQILRVMLADVRMDDEAIKFIPRLAKKARGYSGSDLKELCRTAAREPIREIVAEEARRAVMGEPKPTTTTTAEPPVKPAPPLVPKHTTQSLYHDFFGTPDSSSSEGSDDDDEKTPEFVVRPVSVDDLIMALRKVKRTGQSAREYGRTSTHDSNNDEEDDGSRTPNINVEQLQQLVSLFQALFTPPRETNNTNNRPSSSGRGSSDDDVGDVPPPSAE